MDKPQLVYLIFMTNADLASLKEDPKGWVLYTGRVQTAHTDDTMYTWYGGDSWSLECCSCNGLLYIWVEMLVKLHINVVRWISVSADCTNVLEMRYKYIYAQPVKSFIPSLLHESTSVIQCSVILFIFEPKIN